MEELAEKKYIRLFFVAVAMLDQNIGYASAYNFNGLFKIDLVTGACEYLAMFPGEKPDAIDLHFCIELYENKLFCFPQRGKYISVYDLEKEQFTLLDLPETKYPYYFKRCKIACSFVHENRIYAVGASYPAVLEIDPDTVEMKQYPFPCGEKRVLFRAGGTFYDGSFYVPSIVSNYVLRFGLEEKIVELLELPEDFPGAWGMASDGSRLWIAPRYQGQKIVCLVPGQGKMMKIKALPEELNYGDSAFLMCFYRGGFIWMYPERAKMVLKIDPKTNQVQEVKKLKRLEEGETYGCWFMGEQYLFGARKPVASDWMDEKESFCFRLDLDTWESLPFTFYFASGESRRIQDWLQYGTTVPAIYREDQPFSLREYISFVNLINTDKKSGGETGTGVKIHRTMLKELSRHDS